MLQVAATGIEEGEQEAEEDMWSVLCKINYLVTV
jgi:hypothetical protein